MDVSVKITIYVATKKNCARGKGLAVHQGGNDLLENGINLRHISGILYFRFSKFNVIEFYNFTATFSK